MSPLRRFWNLLRRPYLDNELREEIETHLALIEEDERRNGRDAEQALQRAKSRFGNPLIYRERALDAVIATSVENAWRDLRYAFRSLARDPGFTVVVVLTLALGIGATATIFSAVDALLLRTAPVARPDRLVSVYTRYAPQATTNPGGGAQLGASSYPDYVDLRDSGVLDSLATYSSVDLALDAGGVTERISGEIVSGNYFDVLSVRPVIGRAFAPDEDQIGSPVRVAVLSYRAWLQRFGGSIAIVGQTIALNGNRFTVIGVAPHGFDGIEVGEVPAVWIPMAGQEEVRPPSAALRRQLGNANLLAARSPRWLAMVGRVRDGDTVSRAAAALDVIGRRLAAAHPGSNRDRSAAAVPFGEGPGVRVSVRPVLTLLTVAVSLVLLIACANVAGLLLARAVTRRNEVAVRIAIGAGRGALVRQWLTEAIVLGAVGATGGTIVGRWSAPMLYGLGIPTSIDLGVNWHVLTFALVIGVATGLVFGIAPALQLFRRDTLDALHDESRSAGASVHTTRLRSAFVVMQFALSVVLLVAAGLFLRTLQEAYAVDLGYRVDRMLVADINLEPRGYSPQTGQAFYANLLDRVSKVPGVEAAGAARVAILSGLSRTIGVSVDGQPVRPDLSNAIPARANTVSDRYLATMGIPVIRGRGFESTDRPDTPHVTIISRSLADRLWPGSEAIGRTLVSSTGPAEVIGIVPDTVYLRATEHDPRPIFYTPLSQNYEWGVSVHIRTDGDPLAILPAVRQIVRDLDAQVVVGKPRRLVDEFDRSLADHRTMALIVGCFSGLALLLAAVGLYGAMAYVVRQRTREVGLRLALGATRTSIFGVMVDRGARLVAVGLATGLLGAWAGARFIQSRLFGISPTDAVTWVLVVAVLVAVGLGACVIPAYNATRTDPAVALRSA